MGGVSLALGTVGAGMYSGTNGAAGGGKYSVITGGGGTTLICGNEPDEGGVWGGAYTVTVTGAKGTIGDDGSTGAGAGTGTSITCGGGSGGGGGGSGGGGGV